MVVNIIKKEVKITNLVINQEITFRGFEINRWAFGSFLKI